MQNTLRRLSKTGKPVHNPLGKYRQADRQTAVSGVRQADRQLRAGCEIWAGLSVLNAPAGEIHVQEAPGRRAGVQENRYSVDTGSTLVEQAA